MKNDEDGGIATLFRLYHRDLIRFLSRIIGSVETAEEIAQDTYLKVMRRPAEAAVIDHPKTYLFTAARNAALDHAAQARRVCSLRCDDESGTNEVAAPDPLPDTIIYHRDRLDRMAEALNELPAPCRRAFVLNKMHGKSHADIAHDLGVSVSMVEKHVMRALSHCRKRLRDDER